MSSSLDKLVSNLPDEAFKYTKEICENKLFRLMKKKGVYPYDCMASFLKFNETKLLKQKDFYSVLNGEQISDDDYQHSKNVWKTLKLQNLGEYHDIYLMQDVLLLADAFENFRKTCLQSYNVGPCHYFT